MRILCLTNMYPGPGAPDYGAFVRDMCDALEDRGHEIRPAVIDTRARGPLQRPRASTAASTAGAFAGARWADVIYGHYLFPTGAVAAAAGRIGRRPWVMTAHGGDVANLDRTSVRTATAAGLAGAAAVIAVSHYLADRLAASGLRLPPVFVANMGVDMSAFTIRDRAEARSRRGLLPDGPVIVAVGGLTERKDPLTLLLAFARAAERPSGGTAGVRGRRAACAAASCRVPPASGSASAVTLTGAIPHDGRRGLDGRGRRACPGQPGRAARARGARGPRLRASGRRDRGGRRARGRPARVRRTRAARQSRRHRRRRCAR